MPRNILRHWTERLKIENLVNTIQTAYLQSSKEVTPPLNKPKIPQEIRNIIKEARRLRKSIRKRRARCMPIEPRVRTRLNYQKAKIKRGVKAARQQQWITTVSSLHPRQGSKFWSTLRALSGQTSPTHPLRVNNIVLTSPADKAAAFANTLTQVFVPNVSPHFDQHRHYVRAEATVQKLLRTPRAEILPNDPILGAISMEEVISSVAKKKTKSAPGRDQVSWKVLETLPPNILSTIAIILTCILRLQHWPTALKDGVFVMIPKPGKDTQDPKNWRPICLLPTISEILESILTMRITTMIEQSNCLPKSQHGFRHNRGTGTALLRLIVTIVNAFHQKKVASALFLDINRAFDTIPHNLLLFKLHSTHNLSIPTIKLFHSFLNNRQCTVRVGATHSPVFVPQAGVPQGCPLSPLLYNLYCADLPVSQAPFKQEYAEDTMYLTISNNTISNCSKFNNIVLPALTAWMKNWRIAPNPDKTVLVHFIAANQGLSQDDKARGVQFWGQHILYHRSQPNT